MLLKNTYRLLIAKEQLAQLPLYGYTLNNGFLQVKMFCSLLSWAQYMESGAQFTPFAAF